jgi:adenosylmethionine-8-amino-7-oxononanoate aminotransferase
MTEVSLGARNRDSDVAFEDVYKVMLHMTSFEDDWARLPMIVSGDGCYVRDNQGRTYIDGLASLFTTQVGHGRSEFAKVAAQQIEELAFFPNWSFHHPKSLELARMLRDIAPGDLGATFFVNSGSEATESVIKLARQYHEANGEPTRRKFISRKFAYHGVTMGALSLTGVPAFKAPFEPLLDGFIHIANTKQDPKGAAEAVREAIEFGPPETVAAVVLEPVQNSGGCLVPPPNYWRRVRDICDEYGVLLVCDAVLCGFGRLGEWFGIERFDVIPDVITFAKGVTSGYLPMGGVMMNDRVATTLREKAPMFLHGTTFGGHPVAAAVALENIRTIQREDLLQNVHTLEGYFKEELLRVAEHHHVVKEVRGMGFFWAMELSLECPDGRRLTKEEYERYSKDVLSKKLFEGGLICRYENKAAPAILLAPPLIADRAVIGKMADIIDSALGEFEHRLGYGT